MSSEEEDEVEGEDGEEEAEDAEEEGWGEGEEEEEEASGTGTRRSSNATSGSKVTAGSKGSKHTAGSKSSKHTAGSKNTSRSKVTASSKVTLGRADDKGTLDEAFRQLTRGRPGGRLRPADLARLLKDLGGPRVEGKLVVEVMEELKSGADADGLSKDDLAALMERHLDGAEAEELAELWGLLAGDLPEARGGEASLSLEQLQRGVLRLGLELPPGAVEELVGLAGARDGTIDFETFAELLQPVGKPMDGKLRLELASELWTLLGGAVPKVRSVQAKLPWQQLHRAAGRLGADLSQQEAEDLAGFAGGPGGLLDYKHFVHLLSPPGWGLPPKGATA